MTTTHSTITAFERPSPSLQIRCTSYSGMGKLQLVAIGSFRGLEHPENAPSPISARMAVVPTHKRALRRSSAWRSLAPFTEGNQDRQPEPLVPCILALSSRRTSNG